MAVQCFNQKNSRDSIQQSYGAKPQALKSKIQDRCVPSSKLDGGIRNPRRIR